MALNQFTPNAGDRLFDPATGQLTEIGRILIRNLSAAVGELAPINAEYWTSTPASALTNERNIGALASGYLKIVTAVGIATPSTAATIPQADVSGLITDLGTLGTAIAALTTPVAFAALPGTPTEGMIRPVNDSTTNVWGAVIAGGGANKVLGFYNGTNWTVAAK